MQDFEELAGEFIEGTHLWAEAAKYWGVVTQHNTVQIGRVLGRWIVAFDSDQFNLALLRAVKVVYEAILALDMDLEQSLRLFDSNGDGTVELKEFRQVLGMFDVGLTSSQLERLTGQIFNNVSTQNGFKGKINVQEFLGHFTTIYKQASSDSNMEGWMQEALEQIGKLIVKTPAEKLVSGLEQAAVKIQSVARGAAARNQARAAKEAPRPTTPTARRTVAPRETIAVRENKVAIARARSTVRTEEKAKEAGVGEICSMGKLAALFRALDVSGDGLLQIEEFVSGLEQIPGVTGLTVEGVPLTHEKLVTLVHAIDVSKNGNVNYLEFLQAFQLSEDGGLDVEETLLEDITTVLFRHRLAIRKGCLYFDEEGHGSVFAEDFKKVLHAVNNTLARPERTLTNTQINILVEALAVSEADAEDSLVDYEGFLRSFVIVDKEKDRAVVKRF